MTTPDSNECERCGSETSNLESLQISAGVTLPYCPDCKQTVKESLYESRREGRERDQAGEMAYQSAIGER